MAELYNGACECGERCSCPPGSDTRARCSCWHPGEQKPIKVYGLLIMHTEQKPLIEKHCFGDCGKVSMAGGITDDQVGALMVCCEEACPWLKKQMDEPYGTTMSFGKPHEVYLRTLTDTPAGVAPSGEARPMQGLADWLRAVAETQAKDAENEACIRQWAREVDAACGVKEGCTYPECSGDPQSCPENEGFGCCGADGVKEGSDGLR